MNKFVKFASTTLVLALSSTAAFAETSSNATIEDHYKTVTKQIPYTEQVCNNVEVPIYGRTSGGASAGDVLGGMIIGGLIGKGATNDDKGAAAGAVIGGMIAADKKQSQETIIGYRQETRCNNVTRYDTQIQEVYSHSTVRFKSNGQVYILKFQK